MYELTCPFCKVTTTSSFVRVGAVATCRQCHHQFAVKAENVHHVARPAGAELTSAAVTMPESVPGDETAFPRLSAAAPAGPATAEPLAGGAAAVSQIGQAGGTAVIAPAVTSPAARVEHTPQATDRRGPSPRWGNYDINPLTWLIAGAILAAAAWGMWLVVQWTRGPSTPPTPTSAPATQVASSELSPAASIPRAVAAPPPGGRTNLSTTQPASSFRPGQRSRSQP